MVLSIIEKASWCFYRDVERMPLGPLKSAVEAEDRTQIKAALSELSKDSIGDINGCFIEREKAECA